MLLCVHSDLQLEYLDLYLIHWPLKLRKGSGFPPRQEDFLPLDIKSTWEALEHTVELGLTRAIGVANFSSKRLESLLQYAKIQPAVDQVKEELAIYYGSITKNTMQPPSSPCKKTSEKTLNACADFVVLHVLVLRWRCIQAGNSKVFVTFADQGEYM